jgi:hypothetical protein
LSDSVHGLLRPAADQALRAEPNGSRAEPSSASGHRPASEHRRDTDSGTVGDGALRPGSGALLFECRGTCYLTSIGLDVLGRDLPDRTRRELGRCQDGIRSAPEECPARVAELLPDALLLLDQVCVELLNLLRGGPLELVETRSLLGLTLVDVE